VEKLLSLLGQNKIYNMEFSKMGNISFNIRLALMSSFELKFVLDIEKDFKFIIRFEIQSIEKKYGMVF
jgi:hypothetical protein